MQSRVEGFLITSTGAVMWGLNAVAGKFVMGTKGVDPVWMVTLRLICAGLILLGIAVCKSKGKGFFDIWKEKQSVIRLLAVAVFAFAMCQISHFLAVNLSNAGIATAIQQTSPVLVLFWVMLLERRLPKKVEILVLTMVIFGAFMLATGGQLNALIVPPLALIMAIISAVSSAIYTILPVKLIERYGTFYTVGWGMLVAGICLIPISKLWIVSGTWDVETVLGFSFVVICGTVVSFGAFLYGVTLVGPLVGSVLGLIEPVVAALASTLFLKHVFTIADIIGIVFILAGVAILSVYKSR